MRSQVKRKRKPSISIRAETYQRLAAEANRREMTVNGLIEVLVLMGLP